MGDLMWRVMCEGGSVQTVGVAFAPEVGSWAAVDRETDARGAVARAYHATPRQAVTAHAARSHWPVVEIRSPGEPTTAEQIAAERDADVAALKRELVATRVSALAQGNAATVLLAGQSSLRAERDAARAEADALRVALADADLILEQRVDRHVIVEGPVEEDDVLDSGVTSVMTGIEETVQGLVGRTVRIVVEVLPEVTP